MTIRLIEKPAVHLVGWSEFDPSSYLKWAHDEGLDVALSDETTPVARMMDRIMSSNNGFDDIATIPEFASRVCYESYTSGRGHDDYIENIITSGHGSVLEHSNLTFFVSGVSRTLTHELVRHRAGVAPSQLSQRFTADRLLSGTASFVVPAIMAGKLTDEMRDKLSDMASKQLHDFKTMAELIWSNFGDFDPDLEAKLNSVYARRLDMSRRGMTPKVIGDETDAELTKLRTSKKKAINEAAREFLPQWVETKIVVTMNVRAIRHVLGMRGSAHADKQIRTMACAMLEAISSKGNLSVFRDVVDVGGEIVVGTPKV